MNTQQKSSQAYKIGKMVLSGILVLVFGFFTTTDLGQKLVIKMIHPSSILASNFQPTLTGSGTIGNYTTGKFQINMAISGVNVTNFILSGEFIGSPIQGVFTGSTGFTIDLLGLDGIKSISGTFYTGLDSVNLQTLAILDFTSPFVSTIISPSNGQIVGTNSSLLWSSTTDVGIGMKEYSFRILSGASDVMQTGSLIHYDTQSIYAANLTLPNGSYTGEIYAYDKLGLSTTVIKVFFVVSNVALSCNTMTLNPMIVSGASNIQLNAVFNLPIQYGLVSGDIVGGEITYNGINALSYSTGVRVQGADGARTILFKGFDGVQSAICSKSVILDSTPPNISSASVSFVNNSTNTNSTQINLVCAQETLTPPTTFFFSTSNSLPLAPTWQTCTSGTKNVSLPGNGTYTGYVWFKDMAGNVSSFIATNNRITVSIPTSSPSGGGGGGSAGLSTDQCGGERNALGGDSKDYSYSYYDGLCSGGSQTGYISNSDYSFLSGSSPYTKIRYTLMRYRSAYNDDVYARIILKDIKNSSNKEAITTLKNFGIARGYKQSATSSQFRPSQKVTVAEFIKMTLRSFYTPENYKPKEGFSDQWYKNYIKEAKDLGVSNSVLSNPESKIKLADSLIIINTMLDKVGKKINFSNVQVDALKKTVSRGEVADILTLIFNLTLRDSYIAQSKNASILATVAEYIKTFTPEQQYTYIVNVLRKLETADAEMLHKKYNILVGYLIEDLTLAISNN